MGLSDVSAKTCSDTFTANPEERLRDQISRRLSAYFGQRWILKAELSDADSANHLWLKVRDSGSLTDLKIFSTYLAVLEATGSKYDVRAPGFYVDMRMGERPKSTHFQERHWDWAIFQGYFLNAPSSITFTKEADLRYLEFVLRTAKAHSVKVPLKDVLIEANHKWALQESDAESRTELSRFVGSQSYLDLYRAFVAKARAWAFASHNRDRSLSMLRETLLAFRQSNSTLDLMILNRYFDLSREYGVIDDPNALGLISNDQVTDPRIFDLALSTGSIQDVTDFLFQNSHDVQMKSYLLSILREMPSSRPRGVGFYEAFGDAKASVESRLPNIEAPEHLQADLHVFSESDEAVDGVASEVIVRWNKKLGKIQCNVAWVLPKGAHARAKHNPTLVGYLKQYFDRFRKDGTLSESEIQRHEQVELETSMANATYLVFTKPGSTELLAIVRILEGRAEVMIERDFPHLVLEERIKNTKFFELGRLMATDEVEANSFNHIMARVAEYFSNTNAEGAVYVDGNRGASAYYRRHGAQTVYGPEQLRIAPGATQIWVLRTNVRTIIEKFAKPVYETVRLRRRAPSS